MARHPMLLLPLLLVGACTAWSNDAFLLVSSDPPGAHITVDGRDTGLSTPARLSIGGNFGADHDVQVTKKGYRTITRRVYQQTEGYTSKWIDGVYDLVMIPLPLFWTTGDMLLPFAVRGELVPHELHVKLYRSDEPKLGFEVLADRAAAAATPTQPK